MPCPCAWARLLTPCRPAARPHSTQITLSDWVAPSLSADQLCYATLDAALVWHIAVRV